RIPNLHFVVHAHELIVDVAAARGHNRAIGEDDEVRPRTNFTEAASLLEGRHVAAHIHDPGAALIVEHENLIGGELDRWKLPARRKRKIGDFSQRTVAGWIHDHDIGFVV